MSLTQSIPNNGPGSGLPPGQCRDDLPKQVDKDNDKTRTRTRTKEKTRTKTRARAITNIKTKVEYNHERKIAKKIF